MPGFLKRLTLTHWILIGLAVGIAFGYFAPEWAPGYKVLSNLFLRLIKCIIVPILFGTIVVGIAGHAREIREVGRLAFKSLLYFEVVTTLALIFGLTAVNLVRPGDGITLPPLDPAALPSATPMTAAQMIEHVVPKSIVEAAFNNDVLQVVFFAVMFGLALSMLKGRHRDTMVEFCESLSEVMFKFTGLVMKFAPLGIGGAIAVTVSHSGIEILKNLAVLVLTLYGTLAAFILIVFVPTMILCRVPMKKFWHAVKRPAAIAFVTTSSDAALPDALQAMVRFGVPKRIVSFVMPLGYSFNLDGSTLYLAIASIFCAQAAGIELSWEQQGLLMLSLMLSTKGIAAVPRASFVILSGTVVAFGIPPEAALLILGVDEFMDTARTGVNLIGNCLASVVMARWEGEFDPDHPDRLIDDEPNLPITPSTT
ncbi:MAG: cation:dicarboxylase symporter family transporter [Bdellovibrionota bacterium]